MTIEDFTVLKQCYIIHVFLAFGRKSSCLFLFKSLTHVVEKKCVLHNLIPGFISLYSVWK